LFGLQTDDAFGRCDGKVRGKPETGTERLGRILRRKRRDRLPLISLGMRNTLGTGTSRITSFSTIFSTIFSTGFSVPPFSPYCS